MKIPSVSKNVWPIPGSAIPLCVQIPNEQSEQQHGPFAGRQSPSERTDVVVHQQRDGSEQNQRLGGTDKLRASMVFCVPLGSASVTSIRNGLQTCETISDRPFGSTAGRNPGYHCEKNVPMSESLSDKAQHWQSQWHCLRTEFQISTVRVQLPVFQKPVHSVLVPVRARSRRNRPADFPPLQILRPVPSVDLQRRGRIR